MDYTLAVSDVEVQRYLFMAERAQAGEAELWQRAGIGPGAVVADVGCGPAATSAVIAKAVAPNGRVIGVERDESALAAGAQVITKAGVSNVELRQGTATETGLEPGTLDVVMMRHVLAHNGPDEQRIVDHLAQLLRPGGHVYLVDVDATAIRSLGGGPELDELNDRYRELHRRRGNDLQPGLRLGRLIEQAGLELVVHDGAYEIVIAPPGVRPPSWAAREVLVSEGLATSADLERWAAAFERMDANPGQVTMFLPRFVGIGRASG